MLTCRQGDSTKIENQNNDDFCLPDLHLHFPVVNLVNTKFPNDHLNPLTPRAVTILNSFAESHTYSLPLQGVVIRQTNQSSSF